MTLGPDGKLYIWNVSFGPPPNGLGQISRWLLLLALLIVPQMVQAQWSATVGAQSSDKGDQAFAFLPNEIWIHPGG
jgi:hypothetical protein